MRALARDSLSNMPDSPHPSGAAPPAWEGVRELHPAVLASRLASGDALTVVDVRETWEWSRVHLEGAQHIPLGDFTTATSSLDPRGEVVLVCHHGMRSLAAARYLVQCGFERVWNLSGGIDRYAAEVDPSLPRY